MLDKIPVSIPKGAIQTKLKGSGRIAELSIYRSMTSKETKDLILDSFKDLDVDNIEYLQANRDNGLQIAGESLDACGVIKLAGSGSLYVHQLNTSTSCSMASGSNEGTSQDSVIDSNKQQLFDRAEEVLTKLEVMFLCLAFKAFSLVLFTAHSI